MNTDFRLPGFLRNTVAAALVTLLSLVFLSWTLPAKADSVGQVQTVKSFAPETVKMLVDRLLAGQAGLQQGDVINYIIQFATIANGATVGAGGYVTDYIPAGTEVVGAWFVQPSGSDYIHIAPGQASTMPDGWGLRGQGAFNANWATTDAATATACANAGQTLANCTARLSEVYADTGIFFSTDPRTAGFTSPSTDGRVLQGGGATGNGYYVTPTAELQLNPLVGQTSATTHNYWDASNTNAFGSTAIPAAAPRSDVPVASTGIGAGPFNAGSAVAGPDVGYKLDYTGTPGPWRRIYYPGSMMGTNALGPSAVAGVSAIGGVSTIQGWGLSTSNPLPSNTNAVRWAVGRLTVGVPAYVKISLRVTAPPPSSGLINNAEVFGGDASADTIGKGKDMSWRYHVPSVASSNTNLLVAKSVVGVCSGTTLALAQSCTPVASNGNVISSDFVKLRYRLAYLNTGSSTQTNVELSDVLPFAAGAVKTIEAGNIYVISGMDIRSATTTSGNTLSNNGAAAGAARGAAVALTSLTGTTVQQTATFATMPTLVGGSGGSLEIDTIVGKDNTNVLVAGAIVGNKGTVLSAEIPSGATATVISTVADQALLQVSKTTSTPNVAAGGTATYTITVTNTGNLDASAIVINDLLPFSGTVADATRRFSYVGTAGAPGTGTTYGGSTPAGTVTLALALPPTVNGYTANANQQQVRWTFPAASTLAPSASFTLTFNAAAGSNVPASALTYNNDVVMNYSNGTITTIATAIQAAPITVTFPLKVTKTIDCLYNSASTQCNAYTGDGVVSSNAKVRYKLAYENTGATAQSNVYLCDQISSSQSSPALTSTISQPTLAPTPTGPYLDAPGLGAPAPIVAATAAATACGYSGTNTYAFPVIPSLAAGATGVVYFDLTTNVTNTSNLSNTGKIANSGGTASSVSTVSAVARDVANLTVSKTTTTPALTVGGTASYTITLTNIGNVAAGNINVYDFLPYVGTTADATRRFNYAATSATTTLTGVTPTTAVAPTVTPNSSNTNQQQVLWNFGTVQTLAPGASATITFTAQAGSAIATSSAVYGNDVQVRYTHGAAGTAVVSSGINSAAPVTIPVNLSITKSIDCVYAGAICTVGSYVTGDGLPVNAKIRYKLSYQNIGTVTQTNVILSDTLPTQTAAGSVSNVVLVSGTTPPTTAITPASPAAAGATFSFATMASMAVGASGVVTFDVQTTAAIGNTITNLGKIVSAQDAIGKTSSVSASVTELNVTKTIDCVYNGATCTAGSHVPGTPITSNAKIRYKIAYSNPGTAAVNTITICDQLPAQIFAASATYVTNFASTGTAPTGQTYPAVAACGLTGSNNFSYSNTMNLAAGASGTVLFDVQTNASANEVVTNVGKLVAGTQNVSSSVSAKVGTPTLVVTKTASPAAAYLNGPVTYSLTVTNAGNVGTQTLKVFDFLPFSGAAVDATKRIAFDPTFTPTFTYTGTAAGSPVRTDAVPPAIYPYSNNPNQQQVLWDFGSYALPPGGSITITFRSTVGSAMPEASYYNTGYTEYTSASGSGNANAITALISVTNPKPALLFLKTVAVTSDPVNGNTDPKNIPGAEVLYTLRVTNTGPGTVDNNTLVITDPIPANTILFVGDLGSVAGSGPVSFLQGTPTSNLTWTYGSLTSLTDDLEFSNDNGATWSYLPTPPYDAAVNRIRLSPKGTMAAASGGVNSFFELQFRVRLK